MRTTILSYQNIIEEVQNGDTKNIGKYKEEIENMQKQILALESQRNKLL